MILVKIPLVLMTAFAVVDVTTPPNEPLPLSEQVQPDDAAEASIRSFTKFLGLPKALYWGCALIETAAILAQISFKPTPWSCIQSKNIRISLEYLAMWLLSIAGMAIRRSCYRTLGRLFTFELGIRRYHRLVTTGPYAIVRHPSYTGAVMCVLGSTISFFTPGSWIAECYGGRGGVQAGFVVVGAPLIFLLVKRIENEEEMLRTNFGEEWEAWRRKVPYKLIPGIY